MKIKALFLVCGISCMTAVFAGNEACAIEIKNDTPLDLIAGGQFDYGEALNPYMIPSGQTYRINLMYRGLCHDGMQLIIQNPGELELFNAFVPRGVYHPLMVHCQVVPWSPSYPHNIRCF
jgi:hypothetical protein